MKEFLKCVLVGLAVEASVALFLAFLCYTPGWLLFSIIALGGAWLIGFGLRA